MWCLLAAVALAGSPEVGVEVGHQAAAPVGRFALGAAAGWRVDELFAVRVHAMYLGDAFRGDTVIFDGPYHHVVPRPQMTRVVGWAGAEAVFSPVPITFSDGAQVRVDLGVGMSLVNTWDDLRPLQGWDDPLAEATARQWLLGPSVTWGVRGPISARLELALRVRHGWFIDTLASVDLVPVRPTVISLALTY